MEIFHKFLGLEFILKLIIIGCIFVISNQLIYYYNYCKGIEPTFLSVFEMMSGLVTPNSIGLSDPQSVVRFIKTFKTLSKINEFICTKTTPFMGLMILSTFISYKPILPALLCGIPNAILFSFYNRLFFVSIRCIMK